MGAKERMEIGVLIERSRAYGRQLCEGVAAFAMRRPNWRLTLLDGHDLDDRRRMLAFDGLICRFLDTRVPRKVLRYGKPTVDVYHDRPLAGIAAVDSDHFDIGRAAAEHFLDRHFTHFAFCGYNDCEYSNGRRRGFAETLAKRGFKCLNYATPQNMRYRFDNDTIFSDPTHYEDVDENLHKWVATLPKPVAVFCSHDFCAYQLVQSCLAENLAIPGDIAVLGVDNDTLLCSFTSPTISSVDPDAFGVGYAAAETLADLIASGGTVPDGVHPRYIPCRGVVSRESTDIYPIKPEWLSEAMLFIQHNVDKGISASDVCNHIGRSHTTVARAFADILHSTIQRKIAESRMKEAKRLLEKGLTPAKVAAQSGFRSLAYFSNCFTASYGKPPSRYCEEQKVQRSLIQIQ